MSEARKRAIELLKAATPGPWLVGYGGGIHAPHRLIATVGSNCPGDSENAKLIAEAPGLLRLVCYEAECRERRHAEAEAERDALREKLAAAESKVARLETRTAVLCDCVSCCSGHVAPDIEDACPDCHGSGAVIVEGGE